MSSVMLPEAKDNGLFLVREECRFAYLFIIACLNFNMNDVTLFSDFIIDDDIITSLILH